MFTNTSNISLPVKKIRVSTVKPRKLNIYVEELIGFQTGCLLTDWSQGYLKQLITNDKNGWLKLEILSRSFSSPSCPSEVLVGGKVSVKEAILFD
jgi:hypothetical protein